MYSLIKGLTLASAGFGISAVTQVFGGFDTLLRTLLVFMAVDFVSGIAAAVVFKTSDKTDTGRLSSRAGFEGLIKKGCCLLLIAVAVHLDALLGTNSFTRDAVIIAFILNELLSILENMGRMGIKLPAALTNAMEMLNKRQAG